MSDRMVRDELLTSERYWSVSPEARNLFMSLILSADDTGRYTAARFALRTKCMAGTVSPERLEKILLELVDVDLIRLYSEGNYLFIPRFRQRLRYRHSRYPDPPPEINDIKDIAEKKSDSGQTQVGLKTAEVKRREEKVQPDLDLGSGREVPFIKRTPVVAKATFVLPEWIPKEPWEAWIEMRRKQKKPPTNFALKLAVMKLENLREQGEAAAQVLMQSAFKGWTDLYPVGEAR